MSNNPADRSPYPVNLIINTKKCLVVGGGRVAARKAETLVEHGGRVTVVGPLLCTELECKVSTGEIRHVPRCYSKADLDGMFLVIAATDNAHVNQAVSTDARQSGVLVNVVDNEKLSDFILPACFSRGAMMVAVSTSGKSPALSRKIKHTLEEQFGPEYDLLVELVARVRRSVSCQEISASTWQRAIDIDVLLEFIRQQQQPQAEEWLKTRLFKIESKD